MTKTQAEQTPGWHLAYQKTGRSGVSLVTEQRDQEGVLQTVRSWKHHDGCPLCLEVLKKNHLL